MPQPSCLIIGAGAGNGAAIARQFGARGHTVYVASRRSDEMQKLAQSLASQGVAAVPLAIDAANPSAVADAVAKVPSLEVLVYNASGATYALPTALTAEQLTGDLTISVVSALAAAQAALPAMAATRQASILLTGGGFALRPMASLTSLGVGKAAIRNLAFSLAEELSPKGIRVGTVTILGMVKPGTAFDPDKIAAAFWRLHDDRDGKLAVELQFAGGD